MFHVKQRGVWVPSVRTYLACPPGEVGSDHSVLLDARSPGEGI